MSSVVRRWYWTWKRDMLLFIDYMDPRERRQGGGIKRFDSFIRLPGKTGVYILDISYDDTPNHQKIGRLCYKLIRGLAAWIY